MTNKTTYESTDIVRYYIEYDVLQKPETVLFDSLKDRLPAMSMLDIGVGAGRTTRFFAPSAGSYVGIDYSSAMVAACRDRFPAYRFEVCDIRSLDGFADNSFDFILFSFNGLDYISHDDRLTALGEIRRVGKPGAPFFFSTHNLQSIERLFTIRRTWHPLKMGYRLGRNLLLRLANMRSVTSLIAAGHAVMNDGTHGFRLKTYYITPEEQVRQLKSAGFADIDVYSVETGELVVGSSKRAMLKDGWVYYRATIVKDDSDK